MKTPITSNWRPLSRALSAFLVAIVALWAVPRNAHAQLYVTQITDPALGHGIVSKYDSTSGQLIKYDFIQGLRGPSSLALSDNTLFVASYGFGAYDLVGKYDATTGGAIDDRFIRGLHPTALALFDNTLFVASYGDVYYESVGKYDATTGAAIGLKHSIKGLNGTALALFRSTLWVAGVPDGGVSANTVGVYNADTGEAFPSKFFKTPGHTSALALWDFKLGLAVFKIFVADFDAGTVGKYHTQTGAVINDGFIKGLNYPTALAVLGDTLFVVNSGNGTIGAYDTKTGAAINANFIAGLKNPNALAIKATK
jgi:hypothetical protein